MGGGETLFNLGLQWLVTSAADSDVLATATPWWCGTCVAQAVWCATFRPRYRASGLLLVPATCLLAATAALGQWHGIVRTAQSAVGSETTWLLSAAHVPTAMHFGWLLAATLVSFNGVAAHAPREIVGNVAMAGIAALSAVVGTGACVALSIARKDPTVGLVGVWALCAVANDMGKRMDGTSSHGSTKEGAGVVMIVCSVGAVLCGLSALVGSGLFKS